MTNECIPFYEAAYTQKITVHAGYAITGKTFVGPLTSYQSQGPALANDPLATGDGGNLICPAAPAAGGQVGGVAAWDAASGGKAGVIRGAGTMLPVTAGGNVAVSDLLKVDTSGRVVTATQVAGGAQPNQWIVGRAHSAATVGVDCVVELVAPFIY